MFAAGQYMASNELNTKRGQSKGVMKQRSRDNDALRSLGFAPVPQVQKIFVNEGRQTESAASILENGKLKFRSHLNDKEKNVVIDVAKGI